MAEVKELEQQAAPQEPTPPAAAPQKKKKKKKLVRRIVALAVAAGLVAGGVVYFRGKGEPEAQVVTDFVTYGAITSTVEGSGLTKSKNSETLMLTTDGVVQEVFVTEGQQVMAGDPLFIIESEAARVAVEKARQNLEGYEKQLSALHKDIAGLNLSPSYPGKLMETVTLNPGDSISRSNSSIRFSLLARSK